MNILPIIESLCDYVEARDFAGYDPYDALNSPLLRALSFGSKWGRIAWTQLLRRCPINLRPLLGVRRGHNPKGIGLFLHGYARMAGKGFRFQVSGLRQGDWGRRIEHLLDLLFELRSSGYSGNCWGYNFDWQSRAAFLPRGTPTIVPTAFIGHALLDAYRWTGNRKALELAGSIPDFILKDLNRHVEGDALCFSYSPADRNFVHNANLLGASLLARLAHAGFRLQVSGFRKEQVWGDECREAALAALRYSMRHQRADGSWPYAETKHQGWIDSFHTGFNLQAIKVFLDLGEAEEYREAFDRGVRFYADNFFLEDGTPKYYHDRVYPIDIHCPAQALAFFSSMGGRYSELCERVANWMVENMRDERTGCFYFRKTPHLTNRIPYMRWSQAWALHALSADATARSSGLCASGSRNGGLGHPRHA